MLGEKTTAYPQKKGMAGWGDREIIAVLEAFVKLLYTPFSLDLSYSLLLYVHGPKLIIFWPFSATFVALWLVTCDRGLMRGNVDKGIHQCEFSQIFLIVNFFFFYRSGSFMHIGSCLLLIPQGLSMYVFYCWKEQLSWFGPTCPSSHWRD